jgi:hypothetical protein
MSITIVPQSIKRLFRVQSCPSEQQLAAYADQQLIGNERNLVERHLTTCDACLRQVGFLVRTASMLPEQTPDDLLRSAMNFGTKGAAPVKRYAWQWLAVASAVVVMVAVTRVEIWRGHPLPATPSSVTTAMNSGLPVRPTTPLHHDRDDQVRGGQEPSDSILISPKPDEKIDASNLEFRWKLRGDASLYEIEVVSDSGDVIWQQRSHASWLKLPAHIRLEKGKTYYVWIRIHLARGSVEQSKAVRFTIG